ncbi:zinc transporter ZIP12-like [Ptychodera flava]|uniref:zinc transporter ZIP12-like n=1 Tax=Ptychodera flava TaxID=63121 RepID=UPI00396A1069
MQCMSAESLFEVVGADTLLGLSEEQFGRAGVVLLFYLSDLETVCKDITEPSAKNYSYYTYQLFNYEDPDSATGSVLTLEEFESVIEDVNKTYEAVNFAKCFTDHSIFEEDVEMENSTIGADFDEMESVAAVTVSYLLFGYCIGTPTEVDPESFIHNIFELYGEEDVISVDNFESLQEKMGIGHGDDSHGGHVHKRSVAMDTVRSLRDIGQRVRSNAQRQRSKRAADDDHDDHDHGELTVEECFDADELLHIYDIDETVGIDEQKFLEMCPSFVQQIVSDACVAEEVVITPATWQMYLWGTLTVLLISLLALLGVLFIPLASRKAYHTVMQTLTALAVGTMTTDALLHLIPHALELHGHSDDPAGHSDDKSYIWKMTVVMTALYGFFVLERSLSLVSTWLGRNKIMNIEGGTHMHGHSHSHNHTMKPDENTDGAISPSTSKSHLTEEGSSDKEKTKFNCFSGLNSVAIMIIVGDAFHNLADGMAIGAAYCIDAASGVSTAIAVLCHELPHEMGDFAILVSSGLSYKMALGWNFFCACCGFIGLYIGLAVGSVADASTWILALTAGMFLYVALVDMIPELMLSDQQRPWTIFICQNVGFLIGFVIILLLAIFEEDIRISIGM